MEKKTNLKQALIISSFAGCGKTYAFNHYQDQFLMLDSDSSEFSWIKDENGINTKNRNPVFPENYIEHIKENLNKVDIIFVSSHDVVRKALEEAKLDYYLVFPFDTMENRDEWFSRYLKRKSPKSFISFIDDNWSNFISDMEIDYFPSHIRLGMSENKILYPWFIDNNMLKNLVCLEEEKNFGAT